MPYNEWPLSNSAHSPVWIQEIHNCWGFFGRCDRTGYRVWNAGREGEIHVFYESAAKEAKDLYDAWAARRRAEMQVASENQG